MSTETLRRGFLRIGARLEIEEEPWLGSPRIDVRSDRRKGEYFDVSFRGGDREVGVEIVDAHPGERHLLLLVRDGDVKSKFLCGHDERSWFVAAIPEGARGVSGVTEAMVALQPAVVREAVDRKRPARPLSRRNEAFRRQGEWYFVPVPSLVVSDWLVLHDEPIFRGRGSTPHLVENVYRRGGETVYVSRSHPNGITQAAFDRLPEKAFVRDSEVFARGAVRHPDHATIVLDGWHRVVMNTENQSEAMRHVVFLD